jgi:hypothetical protein
MDDKVSVVRKRCFDLGIDYSGTKEQMLRRLKSLGEENIKQNIVPLIPSSWFIVYARKSPPSDNVTFVFRDKLCFGELEAKETARRFAAELGIDRERGESDDELDLRVMCDPWDCKIKRVSDSSIIPWEKKEKEQEEEQDDGEDEEEERFYDDGELSQEDKSRILCFLWVLPQLPGRPLVKDVVKLIVKEIRSKKRKPLTCGVWLSGIPKLSEVYLCRISILVPTYDFLVFDASRLIVASTRDEAVRLSKVCLVQAVNGRWRDGFQEVRDKSQSDSCDGYARL